MDWSQSSPKYLVAVTPLVCNAKVFVSHNSHMSRPEKLVVSKGLPRLAQSWEERVLRSERVRKIKIDRSTDRQQTDIVTSWELDRDRKPHNFTHLAEHLIDPLGLLGVGEGTHLLQTWLSIVFNLLGVLDREKINPMNTWYLYSPRCDKNLLNGSHFIFVGMLGFFQASYPMVPGLIIIFDSRMLHSLNESNWQFSTRTVLFRHLEKNPGKTTRQNRPERIKQIAWTSSRRRHLLITCFFFFLI